MRDFPSFETQYGVAGLVLNQIPYTKTAFIHLIHVISFEDLLAECRDFCVACGAELIFAAGDPGLEKFEQNMQVIEMMRPIDGLPDTDACLIPVTEKTLERWLQIYHQKMSGVDNAAHISWLDGQKMVKEGGAYFVHRSGDLLGIGMAKGDRIDCVASLVQGAGETVMLALCHALSGETVHLDVASTNARAIRLYERMGFVKAMIKRRWYQVL